MKRIATFIVFAAIAATAFGQVADVFMPQNPIVMGQGGSFVANAEGYNSFFFNPAGFARQAEFTLASANAWAFADRALVGLAMSQLGGAPDDTDGETQMRSLGLDTLSRQTTDGTTTSSFDLAGMLAQAGISAADLGIPEESLEALGTQIEVVATWAQDTMATEEGGANLDAIIQNSITRIQEENPALAALAEEIQTSLAGGEGDTEPDIGSLVPQLLTNIDAVTEVLTIVQAEATAAGTPIEVTIGEDTVTFDPTVVEQAIADAIPRGNMSVGAMVGLGWVGNGLGLGLFVNTEAAIGGENLLQARGTFYNTLSASVGLGFNIWDGFSVGFAVRPTMLSYAQVSVGEVAAQFLAPADGGEGTETTDGDTFAMIESIFNAGILYGLGIGFDAGALLDVGPFTFGAAVKDIFGTRFAFRQAGVQEFVDSFQYDQQFPEGTEVTPTETGYSYVDAEGSTRTIPRPLWSIPMKISAGAQFHPDLGGLSFLIDPRVSFDLYDAVGFIRRINPNNETYYEEGLGFGEAFLDSARIGGEVTFLRLVSLRAGLYQDYLSIGAGAKLLFADVNAALLFKGLRDPAVGEEAPFAEYGFDQNFDGIGLSVEAAIRF